MKGTYNLVLGRIAVNLFAPVPAPEAGTFTTLNQGDPWLGWSSPRINHLGQVALVRSTTTNYSGAAYLWTGSWATTVEFPGTRVENQANQPKLEFNDNGRIAFRTSSEGVRVANTTGIVSISTAYPLNTPSISTRITRSRPTRTMPG